MSYLLLLAGIAGVHLVAVMSPGPAFVMATRIAVTKGRAAAICAALGFAVGAVLWALAAVLGMEVVLARAPWLYTALQLAGGAYLVWLGIQAWRHAKAPLAAATGQGAVAMGKWRAFRLGVATNAANPKVVVFFGSIFVTLFTPDMPGWVRVAALLIVAVNETSWYVAVALLFSAAPTQSAYRRAKRFIDRGMGGVLVAFGLRLLAGARA
jgi:RhtB (resistance to homoserine/threonine) family protein